MSDASEKLQELVELRKLGSPAPWVLAEYRGSQGHDCIGVHGPSLMVASVQREQARPDAAFIAAAGSFDFAALSAELARLRKVAEAAKEAVDALDGVMGCDDKEESYVRQVATQLRVHL